MKKQKRTVIFITLLLCTVLAGLATEAALFLPDDLHEKRAYVIVLFVVSLLTAVLGIFIIKAMSAFSSEVQQGAARDPLTGLYNRETFWGFLSYEIERSKRHHYRFTLMIVDLDNFKTINDIYGHVTGDAYLREFASQFREAVRKGDIACRYGGDEFAAILPVCDEGQSYIAANRFLDTVRTRSVELSDGPIVQLTASVGLAVFPDHAKDAESLFLVADTMLHQAKSTGKDSIRVPSDDVAIDNLKSAGEKSIFIMNAIRRKQIVPYFQPIVSASDGSVLAYEVLTRIVTPDKVFSAVDFIEEAEGMGAIGKIDYQLIEQAFAVKKNEHYKGRLFLNLSPKALLINEFMPTVQQLMRTYGVEPDEMVFEITERNSVKGLNSLERSVRDLKQDGFKFAIDDFGSGYSSFQYIRLFQVDFLKIDGEFIRNMTSSGGVEQAIVNNISGLARVLGIRTIAEYVESEQILGCVKAAGIDYAQGFYIRQPMPSLDYVQIKQPNIGMPGRAASASSAC